MTCRKQKADPKAVRLWFKLNENTNIQVRTGVGLTKYGRVGAVVGQGMLGGALVSQAVLDEGVIEHLPPGGELQLKYGEVPQAPLMWIDGVLNATDKIQKARRVNEKMDFLLKQRGLSLNEDKSVCLIIGTKRQKEQLTKELHSSPLMCGNFETKEQQLYKWLGQTLSSAGLSESVAETVSSKEGKVKGACLEIAIIVNDWRAGIVGGFETALMLWEACHVPSILHGAGTWVEMSTTTD